MKLGADLGEAEAPALIGVSAGKDSVALLHALVARGVRRLVVCHFDHGWRAEGKEEAAFVKGLGERAGLEVELGAANELPQREAAAREARYEFFERVAMARGLTRLYLAHHADDQVETMLFNLLRGAGGAGLAAMQPVSRRGPLEIVRPLLAVWRAEIEAYVAEHELEYREDASNTDTRFARNRIRHEALPALEAAMRRPVKAALWKAAAILAAENEYFRERPELSEVPLELAVAELRLMPVALQRRVLHAWLAKQQVAEVSFDDVEAIRRMLYDDATAKVNLAGDRHARRRAGKLFLD